MHIYNIMYNISTLDVVKLAKYDNLLNKHFTLTKQRNIFAYLLSDKNSIFLILFFMLVEIEILSNHIIEKISHFDKMYFN